MQKNQNQMLFKRITGAFLSAAVCFSAGTGMTGFQINAADVGGDDTMYKLADSCQEGTILHCFNWN